MTKQEAFYIVGNIPIPTDDNNYDICKYQEAKAIALDCIQKIDDLEEKQYIAFPHTIGKITFYSLEELEDWIKAKQK